jgi:hypothetical protein
MYKFNLTRAPFVVLLFFFSTHSTQAKAVPELNTESMFVLEPYVGLERGYLTQKGVPEITTMGPGYGARLGVRYMGIGFGLDYYTGSQNASQSNQDSDFKPTELGGFINYRFGKSFKVYGAYLFSAKAKVQPNTNPSDFSGSGYKLGVGWSAFTYLDINLEMFNRTYTKYDERSIANSLVSSTFGFSLSFPIL